MVENAPAWDVPTEHWVTAATHFEISVVSVVRCFRGPPKGADATLCDKASASIVETSVHGFIERPKLILFDFSFEGSEGFGGWRYNILGADDHITPIISVWLNDAKGEVAEAIYRGHRDALLSGKTHSTIRLWKRKGDGVMTERDRSEGYSENIYELLGFASWAELQSSRLPKWALPPTHEDFRWEEFTNKATNTAYVPSRAEGWVRCLQGSFLFASGFMMLVAFLLVVVFRWRDAWMLLALPWGCIYLAGLVYEFLAKRRISQRKLR